MNDQFDLTWMVVKIQPSKALQPMGYIFYTRHEAYNHMVECERAFKGTGCGFYVVVMKRDN